MALLFIAVFWWFRVMPSQINDDSSSFLNEKVNVEMRHQKWLVCLSIDTAIVLICLRGPFLGKSVLQQGFWVCNDERSRAQVWQHLLQPLFKYWSFNYKLNEGNTNEKDKLGECLLYYTALYSVKDSKPQQNRLESSHSYFAQLNWTLKQDNFKSRESSQL